MSVIPTVWCPYCDSANELNSKRCWHCRQGIPAQAERTGVPAPVATLPVPATAGHLVTRECGYPVAAIAEGAVPAYVTEVERKQCIYCREWIDPEASVCPSGENAMLRTRPVWPVRVRMSELSDTSATSSAALGCSRS